jgi:hypothetical protein
LEDSEELMERIPFVHHSARGAATLSAALDRVRAAEVELEHAREAARQAARREGKRVGALFSDGRFVARENAEKWVDTARAEERHNAEVTRSFVAEAMNMSAHEREVWGGFAASLRDGSYERFNLALDANVDYAAALAARDFRRVGLIAAAIMAAVEVNSTAAAILAAGARARSSTDTDEMPEPTGAAAAILRAGAKARTPTGSHPDDKRGSE